MAGEATHPNVGLVLVAVAMATGGVLGARRVAETMSRKITRLNPGQGLTANVITALMVTVASRFGLPVSTTHVSVGSLFGIGLVNGTARRKTILAILVAWVTTLPVAAALGCVAYAALGGVGG
jgi:PiT family inorganic phosphate transporter